MLALRLLRPAAFCLFASCLATVSEARAASPVTLHWSAPADCPTHDDVLAEVNRLLGERASANDEVLDVVAQVKRKPNGKYLVRLEIPSPDGPRIREISAASCLALGQTTALILAMMVDPEAALKDGGSGQTPTEIVHLGQTEFTAGRFVSLPISGFTNSEFVRAAIGRQIAPLTSMAIPPPGLVIGLPRLIGDVGSLPGPSLGFGTTIGFLLRRWRIEAGGAYFLGRKGYFAKLPNAGANVNLLVLHGAAGFAIPINSRVEFIPRLRFDVGQFHAASFGVSKLGENQAYSFGLGMDGVLSVRFAEHWRLNLGFGTTAMLVRPKFIITGLGVAHESALFVWRLALGPEVQF